MIQLSDLALIEITLVVFGVLVLYLACKVARLEKALKNDKGEKRKP